MGILSRFKEIMSSNINAMLDKMEDPSKMVDQLVRNLNEDLGKVKAETAGVMAEEKRAYRDLEECTSEINKLQSYAERAVQAGNDADAKQFLKQKASLTTKQTSLKQAYDLAAENASKMRQMHDKLVDQINDLNARRDSIKAKIAVAKTQSNINKIGESVDSARGNLSAFDRMDEKASRMLDEANAMAELNKGSDSLEDLKSKYGTDTSSIDDELEAIKKKQKKDEPSIVDEFENIKNKYDGEFEDLKSKYNKNGDND